MDIEKENKGFYEESSRFSKYFYIVICLVFTFIVAAYVFSHFAPLYKPYILFIIHLFQVILIASIAIQLWLATRFNLSNIVVYQGAIVGAITFVEIASLALSKYMLFSNGIFNGNVSEWFDLLVILLLPSVFFVQVLKQPREVTLRYRTNVYTCMFIMMSIIIWSSYIYFRIVAHTFPFELVQHVRHVVVIVGLCISFATFYIDRKRMAASKQQLRSMTYATNSVICLYLITCLFYTDVFDISYLTMQLAKMMAILLLFRMMYFVSVEQPYLRLEKNQQHMWEMAYYDEVTKLPNKRYLPTLLVRGDYTMYVAIKIERLPYIRAILGEDNANQFICLFVERLQQVVPPNSVLGRLDDNHLLLACECQAVHEQALCERFLTVLNEPVKMCEYSLQPNPIMGVSLFAKDSTNAEQLIKMAQIAMEDAIVQQKVLEFYDGKLAAQTQQNLQLEHNLPSAIANNEMYLEYQPKLNMETGKVDSMEALLRWRQPSGSFISPMQFIPILERTGMMVKVGRWILKQACCDAVTYERTYGTAVQVAVNLSVSQLMQRSIVEDVANALKESGLAPHLLELEITESMTMNSDMMLTILQQLKALGVQIAIDDFGTGYSSLSYLKDFPADTLKVDRSFVELVGRGRRGEAILETVITLAQKLQLKIVAEGIETNEQLQYVTKRGCHYIQGYFISKPIRFEQLEEKLRHIHVAHRIDFTGKHI